MTPGERAPQWRTVSSVQLCLWCFVAVVAEIGLYASYRGHDARFHWFTHFFVGASVALVVMTLVVMSTRRAVPAPLVWPLLGQLYAMFPDFLFLRAGMAHEWWMDAFLGHVSTHFVPGGNVTWYLVFLTAAALYLATVDRFRTATGP